MANGLALNSFARNPLRRTAIAILDAFWVGDKLRRMREINRVPRSPFGSATPHYDASRGLFEFRGTWRRIGQQLAEASPPTELVAAARSVIERGCAADRAILAAHIEAALAGLAAHVPAVRDMLDGVTDTGVGTLQEVALVNLTPQLVEWRASRGCGAVAMKISGGALFGQNLDLGLTNATAAAVLRPDDGECIITHFNPGTLWFTTGLNSRGLFVGGASVNVSRPFAADGSSISDCFTDLMLLSRAGSASEAIDLLRTMPGSGPPTSGIASLLGDIRGDLAIVEYTGRDIDVRLTEKVIIANRFRSENLARLNRQGDPISEAVLSNSDKRIAHAEAWAAARTPSFSSLKDLMRGRSGTGAWCRTAIAPDIGWTSATYCFDLTRDRMEFWNGIAPHRPPRRVLNLADVFGRGFH
jgi:Acyl-coenzyme A:6-aminopenicillanic acid acyl-transferase